MGRHHFFNRSMTKLANWGRQQFWWYHHQRKVRFAKTHPPSLWTNLTRGEKKWPTQVTVWQSEMTTACFYHTQIPSVHNKKQINQGYPLNSIQGYLGGVVEWKRQHQIGSAWCWWKWPKIEIKEEPFAWWQMCCFPLWIFQWIVVLKIILHLLQL